LSESAKLLLVQEYHRVSENLSTYRKKRDFEQTSEPKRRSQGGVLEAAAIRDPEHDATRLHYDLRLEFDGVFKSWR